MHKISFAILFVIVFFISCGVPKYIKQNLTYCFDGNSNGIDTLLNIEGFYSREVVSITKIRSTKKGQWVYKTDTSYGSLMFYDNGIFATNLWGADLDNLDVRHKNIQYYFDRFEETEDKANQNIIIGANYKGSYQILGDTIKVQYVNHSSPLTNTWRAFEQWYKIIDKNTIKQIAYRKLYYDRENQDKSEMRLRMLDSQDRDTLTFNPVKIRPNPDNWLMNKSWFWCNKEEWKKYRQNLKEVKKSKEIHR